MIIEAYDSATMPQHALFYDGSTMTEIGTSGGPVSFVVGINNSGQAVGQSGADAFIWDSIQGIQDLGTLPGDTFSGANGINNLGQVVGFSAHVEGHRPSTRATMWCGGSALDLNDFLPPDSGWTLTKALSINDNGLIVGSGTINGSCDGFLLDLNGGNGPRTPFQSLKRPTFNSSLVISGLDQAGGFTALLAPEMSQMVTSFSAAPAQHESQMEIFGPESVSHVPSRPPSVRQVLPASVQGRWGHETVRPDDATVEDGIFSVVVQVS